jgi:hypothetical protein
VRRLDGREGRDMVSLRPRAAEVPGVEGGPALREGLHGQVVPNWSRDAVLWEAACHGKGRVKEGLDRAGVVGEVLAGLAAGDGFVG